MNGKSRFVLIFLREEREDILFRLVVGIPREIDQVRLGEIYCKICNSVRKREGGREGRKEDWETLFQRRYLGESVESVGMGFNCFVGGGLVCLVLYEIVRSEKFATNISNFIYISGFFVNRGSCLVIRAKDVEDTFFF